MSDDVPKRIDMCYDWFVLANLKLSILLPTMFRIRPAVFKKFQNQSCSKLAEKTDYLLDQDIENSAVTCW